VSRVTIIFHNAQHYPATSMPSLPLHMGLLCFT
jgi:hypothetical protein